MHNKEKSNNTSKDTKSTRKMNRYKPKGWRNESVRHGLASKGIKTANQVKSYKVIGAEGKIDPYIEYNEETKKLIKKRREDEKSFSEEYLGADIKFVDKEGGFGESVLGVEGFKGSQDDYLAKLSDIKTEIEPIYDYLQVNYDMNDEISGIGLSISYKDFNNLFPDINRKELIKLFDYLQDNKEATKEVIKSLEVEGWKKSVKISKEEIYNKWSNGIPIKIGEEMYNVNKMSYGDYFLEPVSESCRGEMDSFSSKVIWLELEVRDSMPDIYKISNI